MAFLRFGKKPVLSTLLAMTILSVSICLFTVALLTGEEESRPEQPGVRPINFGGSNSQREILNVDNDVLVARRRRVELSQEEGTRYTHFLKEQLLLAIVQAIIVL